MPEDLRKKLFIGFGLGVAVVLALIVFSDARELARTLRTFKWELVPLILLLTLFNYGMRFIKWQYYLARIRAATIGIPRSLAIFFAGLAMAMTPGKVGELLKSLLLRRVNDTPVSVSAPIVMAERLTDGIALLILSAGGLVLYQVGVPILALLAFLAVVLIGVSLTERGRHAVLWLAERTPVVKSRSAHVAAIYDSSRNLLSPVPLSAGVGIGVVSWFGECVAFFLVLIGLGQRPSWELLLLAAFVLGASTLIGSASMLPGGLGVADASVTGLLLLTLPQGAMDRSEAVAATLLIRFCTLWFGAGIGVLTMMVAHSKFEPMPRATAPQQI